MHRPTVFTVQHRDENNTNNGFLGSILITDKILFEMAELADQLGHEDSDEKNSILQYGTICGLKACLESGQSCWFPDGLDQGGNHCMKLTGRGERLSEGTSCPRGWAGPLASCFSTLCAPPSKTKPASPSSPRNNTCHTQTALLGFHPPLALFSFVLVLSLIICLLFCCIVLLLYYLLLSFTSRFHLLCHSRFFLFRHIFFSHLIFTIFSPCFIHTLFLPLFSSPVLYFMAVSPRKL